MESTTIPAFVADERGFELLRPELREAVRQAEAELRSAMAETTSAFPEHWRESLEPVLVIKTPQQFMRSLLPFFTELSKAIDVVEMVQKRDAQDLAKAPVLGRRKN